MTIHCNRLPPPRRRRRRVAHRNPSHAKICAAFFLVRVSPKIKQNLHGWLPLKWTCSVVQGALVEAGAEVGPNSVVPPGQLVPAGELWAGNPVQHAGSAHAGHRAEDEQTLAELHSDEFLPVNTGFWQSEK